MKKIILITLFVLISILFTACGQATTVPNNNEPSIQTPQTNPPEEGDPYPLTQTEVEYVSPYPHPEGFEEAKYINYYDLEAAIDSGQVTAILITANREAFVTLADGQKIWTNAVDPDLLTNVITQCGAPCANIEVTNP